MPGRIEGLADGQHRATSSAPCAEPLGDLGQVGAQIAGLVEPVGQFARRSAAPPDRRRRRRSARRHGRAACARRPRCPRGRSRRPNRRCEPVAGRRFPLRREIGAEPSAWCRDRRERCSPARRRASPAIASASRPPSSSRTSRRLRPRSRAPRPLRLVGRGIVARLGALEQRIALDLLVDEAVELDMRQLQQLDRLHQLRRHHQRLRLAQL